MKRVLRGWLSEQTLDIKLFIMPGKYTSSEEKARILAWRQEKVPIKEICARSGRAKSTIMKLLASSKGLPVNTVPKHNSEEDEEKRRQTQQTN